ncbi:Fic family protein [Pediococcus acidilactici]|uniref:Fic family protein n=1 Tax=Pediococcus acidilactici TaxID=1254 RepID=UPI002AFF3945|nr:Fic family protein [Pediococcus acidilactici]WQS11956.1 Fic family protein [Pediococcus acidilactici]
MAKQKIKYKDVTYDKVLFLMYKSEEQIKELAYIALRDCWKECKNKSDKLKLEVIPLDDYNLTFTIEQNNEIITKILVPSVMINFPTVKAAINSNTKAQDIFEEDGVYGLYGVRDKKLLEHIIFSTKNSTYFGEDQIPTIVKKAATYWYKFSKYQVFLNGNKRTGLLLCLLLLTEACMKYSYTRDDMYSLAQKIAVSEMSFEKAYEYLLDGISFDYDRMYELFNELKLKEKMLKG